MSQMPPKTSAKELFRRIINVITFVDLPIRKKFVLFSFGALFWLAIISAIGLCTMFDMSAKSKQMVDNIWPQEKTANIVIRKLRGANISVHNMFILKDEKGIRANYRRAKGTLDDSTSYLNALLKGGQVIDYNRATGQLSEPYLVTQVRDADKRKEIEDAISKISNIGKLVDEISGMRLNSIKGGAAAGNAGLEDKITEYDLFTRDAVTVLNDYAITVGKAWNKFTNTMRLWFNIAIVAISFTFGFAALLSIVFGVFISRSLVRPIRAIIGQIKALSAGDVDLSKKLDVASKDELGLLSREFNKLMDTIGHVTSFKKVIEEDDSIEDIYMRLGRIFREALALDSCVIYEVSNSKNTMKIVYPPEAEGTELYCKRETQLDCDLCRAKRTGHSVSSVEYPDICKYYAEASEAAHVCVPIIVGGNVGGVVQFVCDRPELCQVNDLEKKIGRARQYITEAQPVLEAKRLMKTLKDSAFRDALTGLYNRRFLEESFENLIAGVLRRGTTLGLLMCDLDFFKQTNDQYGHDVGDMVLKETSNVIRKSVRSSDLVIRFGGEEFIVLLIDTKPDDSVMVAEKIRESIEATKVKITGGLVQKTISIGVSEFPVDTQNFWEAIKFADVALYKAKERGRNKVLRFAIDMWVGERY
ncbi:MAG: sensor domain-containing diguanylate cyclase [Nitrospirae bacterium]|nr:sensor domain-containing diguanylate cyclase [Nitrospirota bacterium]